MCGYVSVCIGDCLHIGANVEQCVVIECPSPSRLSSYPFPTLKFTLSTNIFPPALSLRCICIFFFLPCFLFFSFLLLPPVLHFGVLASLPVSILLPLYSSFLILHSYIRYFYVSFALFLFMHHLNNMLSFWKNENSYATKYKGKKKGHIPRHI
mmetsp:Transcript_5443/g.12311  ORF Transcript_5443/g.12311 Transcript_5443/m.12311 type:complete len:153 (+) Transcript_5443:2156-2614(+)